MPDRPTQTSAATTKRADRTDSIELPALDLVLESEPEIVFPLGEDRISLGRGETSTQGPGEILLADRTISSRQAILTRIEGSYILEHVTTARNPSLVNGSPIRALRLRAGDRIALGQSTLVLRPGPPLPSPRAIRRCGSTRRREPTTPGPPTRHSSPSPRSRTWW